MQYKTAWEPAKEHFEAFWNRDYKERCNLAIAIKKDSYGKAAPVREYSLEEKYTNPQYIHENMEYWCGRTNFLYESIPAYYLNFGTAGHCTYFGCRPSYADSTIWFEPILDQPDSSLLVFSKEGRTCFEKHKEIAGRLAGLSRGKYFTAMTDNCGAIDCLAQIRGTDNLLIDMLENPGFVQEGSSRIIEVWKETQKEFFDILEENNNGGSSHGWMQLWSPGRHVQIQCDYSVMISPAMFEEFVLPELEETSQVFTHTTYHLDGLEQLRHLDMILSVKGIDNIQWTPVDGQPKTSESIEALQKIQKAGKGLVLIPRAEEAEFLMKNLSHKGLHLIINDVKDREEAGRIEKLAVTLAHGNI